MIREKEGIAKRKEIAVRACYDVGKILRHNFGQKLQIKSKGDRDLVTNVDQQADETFISLIKKYFPDDGILSEESLDAHSRSGFRWIIDPIDGTHNFIHQIAIFGTSCAVEFEGEVILGAIYMPMSDEFYLAEKGKGAYRNGKKITVSKRKLSEATIIYDSTIRFDRQTMLSVLGEVAEQAFNLRMLGSTVRSLTYVAEGRAEAEIEFSDKLWDFAAGLLIVEEAGGCASDFQGQPWSITTKKYIASNEIIHQDILKILKKEAVK